MQINIRFSGPALLVAIAIGLTGWYLYSILANPISTQIETNVVAPEVPVVMRTAGGLLEVATVKATERFTRKDTQEFWGIGLGTTISQIQVPVLYRYHIELAPEWRFTIKGQTCLVHAPPLKPSLPVAIDTAGLQKYTKSGWARFNKDENLETLERSITLQLQARAESSNYVELSKGHARETVREFITKWLLKEQKWKRSPEYEVIVLFPGEALPSHRSASPSAGIQK